MSDELTGFSPEEQLNPMAAAKDFAVAVGSGSVVSAAFTNRADGSVSEGTGFFINLGAERPELDNSMDVAATHVVAPTVS